MKVHERRQVQQNHPHGGDDEKIIMTRKQKAEKQEHDQPSKKPKSEEEEAVNGNDNKTVNDIKTEFDKFCKATSQHLSIQQMRQILEASNVDASTSDDAVVRRW